MPCSHCTATAVSHWSFSPFPVGWFSERFPHTREHFPSISCGDCAHDLLMLQHAPANGGASSPGTFFLCSPGGSSRMGAASRPTLHPCPCDVALPISLHSAPTAAPANVMASKGHFPWSLHIPVLASCFPLTMFLGSFFLFGD